MLELAIDRLGHLFQAAIATAADPAVGAAYADYGAIAAGELLARGRAADLPWEVVRWGLLELPGQADLEELYAGAAAEWGGRLASFSGVLRALLTSMAEGAEIGTAVRLQQEQVDRRVAAWRLAPPSFAFAVYYLRKKRADLDALRLICLGKLQGVAEATIDARLGGPFMGRGQAVLAA